MRKKRKSLNYIYIRGHLGTEVGQWPREGSCRWVDKQEAQRQHTDMSKLLLLIVKFRFHILKWQTCKIHCSRRESVFVPFNKRDLTTGNVFWVDLVLKWHVQTGDVLSDSRWRSWSSSRLFLHARSPPPLPLLPASQAKKKICCNQQLVLKQRRRAGRSVWTGNLQLPPEQEHVHCAFTYQTRTTGASVRVSRDQSLVKFLKTNLLSSLFLGMEIPCVKGHCAPLCEWVQSLYAPGSAPPPLAPLRLHTHRTRAAVGGCVRRVMTAPAHGSALFTQQTTEPVRWLARSDGPRGERRRSTTSRCHRSLGAKLPFEEQQQRQRHRLQRSRRRRRRRRGAALAGSLQKQLLRGQPRRVSEEVDIQPPSPPLQWIFLLRKRLAAGLPAVPAAGDGWPSRADPEPQRPGHEPRHIQPGWRTGDAAAVWWAQAPWWFTDD